MHRNQDANQFQNKLTFNGGFNGGIKTKFKHENKLHYISNTAAPKYISKEITTLFAETKVK